MKHHVNMHFLIQNTKSDKGVGVRRTGLVVRASDSGSGDPGSILTRVGVLFPWARDWKIVLPGR